MKKYSLTFKVGTRGSKLALTQTNMALKQLMTHHQNILFKPVIISTIGDRDQKTDLQLSPENFFTYDLDIALLNNDIDCAIHSAKDLPKTLMKGLNVVWLPWHEDPRDAIILREGETLNSLPKKPIIGVSSERRSEYAKKRFKNGELRSIRGNIDERIQQLDDKKYDILIMAVAGLNRLGLDNRITEYIEIKDLTPPDGQGYLAMTFRDNDERFLSLRQLFVKPVIFAGSGTGNPKQITLATYDALKECDVCLYDALSPVELLQYLPKTATRIYVGKRQNKHSMKQETISQLIVEYAKQGKKVVRLKGGDPGIFGRLSEEVDALIHEKLPFHVLPGISSLQAATTTTGFLLTRRGTSRGFTVFTPRRSNSSDLHLISNEEFSKFPLVCFMGASEVKKICTEFIKQGRHKNEPAALVFNAGSPKQSIISGNLTTLPEEINKVNESGPGLLLIGETVHKQFIYPDFSALQQLRILVTCTEQSSEKAEKAIKEYGGIPIIAPTIGTSRLANPTMLDNMEQFDWIVITSPSAATHFLNALKESNKDVRAIPKLMVTGNATASVFKTAGINPECIGKIPYSANTMLDEFKHSHFPHTSTKILRFKSTIATTYVKETLEQLGCDVEERILYETFPKTIPNNLDFDAIMFTSPSTVDSFLQSYSLDDLNNKYCVVIGEPTRQKLIQYLGKNDIIVSNDGSLTGMVTALAYHVKLTQLLS